MLADRHIRRAIGDGELAVDPMPMDDCFQPASIDLALSHDLWIPTASLLVVGEDQPDGYLHRIREQGYCLRPGGFVLGSTVERVRIGSSLVGRLEGKSSLARLGLSVHSTAGFFDPGFEGYPTLELTNDGPYVLMLKAGIKIAQMSFDRLSTAADRPYGHPGLGSHYQDQGAAPEPSRVG